MTKRSQTTTTLSLLIAGLCLLILVLWVAVATYLLWTGDTDPSCVMTASSNQCVRPGTYQTCEQVREAALDGALVNPEPYLTSLGCKGR